MDILIRQLVSKVTRVTAFFGCVQLLTRVDIFTNFEMCRS